MCRYRDPKVYLLWVESQACFKYDHVTLYAVMVFVSKPDISE